MSEIINVRAVLQGRGIFASRNVSGCEAFVLKPLAGAVAPFLELAFRYRDAFVVVPVSVADKQEALDVFEATPLNALLATYGSRRFQVDDNPVIERVIFAEMKSGRHRLIAVSDDHQLAIMAEFRQPTHETVTSLADQLVGLSFAQAARKLKALEPRPRPAFAAGGLQNGL